MKYFDLPDAHETAHDVIALPDDGFAVCGEINPFDDQDQAWILRLDSQGDTLWAREWGWENTADWARAILYHDDGLLVFAHGNPPDTPKGGYLIRFDMNGNVEWQTFISALPGKGAADMCEASDGGLLLVNDTHPLVVHTDYEGNVDWYTIPQGWAWDIGYTVDTTMDGGFIVGIDAGNDSGAADGMCGVVSRHSVTGEMEWWDYVYEESCTAIHCVRQLSEGGYIAAGRATTNDSYVGFLMKYAPETGISSPDPVNNLSLEVSPNPCSSVLSVSFSQPEAGRASVQIYDLSGRLISTVADDYFPAGSSSLEWTAPESIHSGCYLVHLETEKGTKTENLVLFR